MLRARSRKPSKRALRDAEIVAMIAAAREERKLRRRYAARKKWPYLRGRGHHVTQGTRGPLIAHRVEWRAAGPGCADHDPAAG